MTCTTRLATAIALICVALTSSIAQPTSAPATNPAPSVRVAAIGGINDFDFWKELAGRFEKQTGIRVETVATGNKDAAAALFRQGGIDLITM
jgi:ABC-type glycerol-3-phosphate transport system substrate-binding protein